VCCSGSQSARCDRSPRRSEPRFGRARAGWLEGEPVFTPANEGGQLLDIRFEHSSQLWPWSGFLALYVRVRDAGASFAGQAAGEVSFTVASPPLRGEQQPRRSLVRMPLALEIIPTPPRRAPQAHQSRTPAFPLALCARVPTLCAARLT